jgi:thiamine biosynthesis lipoprotein
MGTDVFVHGLGAGLVLEEVRRLSAILTRFEDSPLRRLNATGRLEATPQALLEALTHALGVAERTQGLVTPTVLDALEAVGYSKSFDANAIAASSNANVPDWRGVHVNGSTVTLEPGVRVDLGGTAKGWIAQTCAQHFGDSDFTLDAGGDIAIRSADAFTVNLEHPFGGAPTPTLLPAGQYGIATSSTVKRAWRNTHHLIDPRSGQPLQSRFVQVTVICDALTDAEVLTKLALLDERAFLEHARQKEPHLAAFAFDRAGTLHRWQHHAFQALENTVLEPTTLEATPQEVAA